MSDERYSVPQLLNPILFDGNVTMYGFNRTVILTDEMQYYHKSNYTDEQVDFKYIIGMATMLARYTRLNAGSSLERYWRGTRSQEEVEIYLRLHCRHQNIFCIQMGSDVNRFNISLIVLGQVSHKTVAINHNFKRDRRFRAEGGNRTGNRLPT